MELGKSRKTLVSSPSSTTTTSPGSSTTKGVQKFYTKIRHKIEDLPPKITAKLHKTKHSSSSTLSPIGKFTPLNASSKAKPKPQNPRLVTKSVQTSPVKDSRKSSTQKDMLKSQSQTDSIYEKIEVVSSNPNGRASTVYVDSDEECRLSLNDSKISLEDEIFEELEKVAHDEAKLSAVLKNFDKILTDFTQPKPPKASQCKSLEITMSAPKVETTPSPKKLQKSKTCSIIESRCILKKSVSDSNNDVEKLSIGLQKQGNFNTTKSLWNLKDFEEFAKSGKKLEKFENCKLPVFTGLAALNKSVESAVTSNVQITKSPARISALRSKSVWELSGSTQSISASRSRIPIMKSSSIKSLNSRSNSFCDVQNPQKSHRSPPSVSKIVKNINDKSPSPMKSFNRATSSSSLATSTPKMSTPSNNQRRKSLATAVSTPHSLNKIGSLAANKPVAAARSTMKPANSEVSLKRSTLNLNNKYAPLRKQQSSDVLLDKCLEKGHEILRKVEAFGSVTKLDRKQKPAVTTTTNQATARKPPSVSPRNYARMKEQSSAKVLKERKTTGSKIIGKINDPNSSKNNSKEVKTETKILKSTPHSAATPSLNNDQPSTNQVPVETPQTAQTLLYAKEETIKFPHLESCKIIPPVLGSTSEEHAELLVNVKIKQPDMKPLHTTTMQLIDRICNRRLENVDKELYPDSDHDSDDSGHISNENDELLTITSGDCSSSRTSSESTNDHCKGPSPPPPATTVAAILPTTTTLHQRVPASTKISELLEKFEHNTSISGSNNQQRQNQQTQQTPSKKICTAMKIAEVEPVKCIQTHIEIYPTYSKEVILRLL